MARAKYSKGKIKGGRRAFLTLVRDASEHIGEIVAAAVAVAKRNIRQSPGVDKRPDTGSLRQSLEMVVRESKAGKKSYTVRMLRYGLLVESGKFSRDSVSRQGGRNFLRDAFIEVLGAWTERQPMRWNFRDVK